MYRRLYAALKRFLSGSRSPKLCLSVAIEEKLATQDALLIHEYIQDLFAADPRPHEVQLILNEAERTNWPLTEQAKLRSFVFYYGGNFQAAIDEATPYAVGKNIDPDLFIIVIFSLYQIYRYEDVCRMLETVREHEQVFAKRSDFYMCAALAYFCTNRLDEVKRAISAARLIEPTNATIAFNAYAMYFELGDLVSFSDIQREILAGQHQIDQTTFAMATIELAENRYVQGFEMLEVRYKLGEAHRYLNSSLFSRPRWQGQSLKGKTLLISTEQGLGDSVMMARYLPEILSLGAVVLMETQSETISWLAYNFPEIRMFVREKEALPPATFDYWTGTMSLPFLFKSTVASIPGKHGYLKVPRETLDYWHARCKELTNGRTRLKVGLAWSGNPSHRADGRRSVSFILIADAIRTLDIDFFALQTIVPEVRPSNLAYVSDEMVTLADTAALIESMDLIITVDTSVVHIAGSVGKETWLLLPYRYEWRWGLEGEQNNWYASVKVMRQKRGGDWESLLDEVFNRRLLKFSESFAEAI